MNGRVTVVTPTFNRAKQLKAALDSVLTQSRGPIEHIICDNLSSDETSEVVNVYARQAAFPVVYKRERDTGIYQAMNRALEIARGDSVFILNDDDQLHGPPTLARFEDCLNNSDASLVYGDTLWLDTATGEKKYRRHNQMNRLTLVHKGISQQAILYRKEVFKQCGNFDESFRIAGDYEWLLRALVRERVPAIYLRKPFAICALGGLSNSEKTVEQRHRERHEATARHYSEKDIQLAGKYRRYIRKFPLGTTILNWFHPLRLNITTRSS